MLTGIGLHNNNTTDVRALIPGYSTVYLRDLRACNTTNFSLRCADAAHKKQGAGGKRPRRRELGKQQHTQRVCDVYVLKCGIIETGSIRARRRAKGQSSARRNKQIESYSCCCFPAWLPSTAAAVLPTLELRTDTEWLFYLPYKESIMSEPSVDPPQGVVKAEHDHEPASSSAPPGMPVEDPLSSGSSSSQDRGKGEGATTSSTRTTVRRRGSRPLGRGTAPPRQTPIDGRRKAPPRKTQEQKAAAAAATPRLRGGWPQ